MFICHFRGPQEFWFTQKNRDHAITTSWTRYRTCSAINNHVETVSAPPDIGLNTTISRDFLGRPAKFWAGHNLNSVNSSAPSTRHSKNFLRAHISLFHCHKSGQISVPELGNGRRASDIKSGQIPAVGAATDSLFLKSAYTVSYLTSSIFSAERCMYGGSGISPYN